jgi:DNA polymerase-3 subunit delta'
MDSNLNGRAERAVSAWERRGQWPHALLISGGSIAAMVQCASALAQRRLCATTSSCGSCDACRWLASGNHLDFHLLASGPSAAELGLAVEIEGDRSRRIIRKEEVARCLRKLALRARVEDGWRALLLVRPEELHISAANALLKTLEEPGERVFFIIVSSHPRGVLDTIVSRCQQLRMEPPSRSELTALHQRAGESDAIAPVLAELDRRAIAFSAEELGDQRAELLSWLSAIATGADHQRLAALDKINRTADPERTLKLALSLVLDLLRIEAGMDRAALTHLDLADELAGLADRSGWLDLAMQLSQGQPALRRNIRLGSLLMGAR